MLAVNPGDGDDLVENPFLVHAPSTRMAIANRRNKLVHRRHASRLMSATTLCLKGAKPSLNEAMRTLSFIVALHGVRVETLKEALARHSKLEILNTDQGSQFIGSAFTGVLARCGIAISRDGKGA